MTKEVLWITQVDKDGVGSHEVGTLEVPENTYERLSRLPIHAKHETLQPYDVLIDLMDFDGISILSDEPYVVEPGKALWLLKEFFHVPFKVSAKVKTP